MRLIITSLGAYSLFHTLNSAYNEGRESAFFNRYRRKPLYTSIVAGTVKLYRYNRNIVINIIVVNGVECTTFQSVRNWSDTDTLGWGVHKARLKVAARITFESVSGITSEIQCFEYKE